MACATRRARDPSCLRAAIRFRGRGGNRSDAEIDVRTVSLKPDYTAACVAPSRVQPHSRPWSRDGARLRLSRGPGHGPPAGLPVLMVASVACLVAGVGLAAQAHRFGARAALAETLSGLLLILGLGLIGLGLPVFR